MTDDKLRQEAAAAWALYRDNNPPVGQTKFYYKDNHEYWIAGYLAHAAKAEVLERALEQIINKDRRLPDFTDNPQTLIASEALHAYRKGSDE